MDPEPILDKKPLDSLNISTILVIMLILTTGFVSLMLSPQVNKNQTDLNTTSTPTIVNSNISNSSLEPKSFDWCLANGGKNETPNYNAPKVCILENRVYEESCVDNSNYFVIESGDASVGSRHLVKYKTRDNQNFKCEYL